MPAIRTSRAKKAPEGFTDIEETLLEFDNKLKDGKHILPQFSFNFLF